MFTEKDNLTTAKAFESVTTGQVHFSGYSKQRTRVLLQHRSVMDSKPSERGGVGTKYRRGFCVIVKVGLDVYGNNICPFVLLILFFFSLMCYFSWYNVVYEILCSQVFVYIPTFYHVVMLRLFLVKQLKV